MMKPTFCLQVVAPHKFAFLIRCIGFVGTGATCNMNISAANWFLDRSNAFVPNDSRYITLECSNILIMCVDNADLISN